MTYESQATDDLIHYSIGGIRITSRIMGNFSHRIMRIIYFCMKTTNPSRGHEKVKSMIQSEKNLKIIPIKDDDLESFCKSASRMDISYCILKDYMLEGLSHILIYASDAIRASKIIKRKKIELVDVGKKYEAEKGNKVLEKLPDTVAKEGDKSLNPTEERKTENSQSEPTLDKYPRDEFRAIPVKARMGMLNRQAENTLSRLRESPTNLPKTPPPKEQSRSDLTLPLSVAKPVEK